MQHWIVPPRLRKALSLLVFAMLFLLIPMPVESKDLSEARSRHISHEMTKNQKQNKFFGAPQRPIALAAKKTPAATTVLTLKKKWVLMAEILAIVSAYLFPMVGSSGGLLRTDIFLSKVGVFALFFLKGLSIPTAEVGEAFSDWRIISVVQIFSSVVLPIFLCFVVSPFVADFGFRDGLICLAALPCSLNTAVTLSAASGAKTSISFFNGFISRLLGIVMTPTVIALMIGSSTSTSGGASITWNQFCKMLVSLGSSVFLPVVLGQLARLVPIFRSTMRKHMRAESLFSDIILVALVQQSFSDTFLHRETINKGGIFYCITLMPAAYLFANFVFWSSVKEIIPGVDIHTRAAATISACQKSLSFGLPFIRAAFDHRADLAEIVAPLLIFNTVQLLMGSTVVAPILKHLIHKESIRQVVAMGHPDNVSAHTIAATTTVIEEGVAVQIMNILIDIKRSLLQGQIRALLSSACFFCVLVELYEGLLSDIPGLSRLTGKLKIQHGVLLLSISHLLNHINGFLSTMSSREESSLARRRTTTARRIATAHHSSEEQAARAYDAAARIVFGPNACQNFVYSPEVSGKVSKYRGVVWDPQTNSWTVDLSSLDIDDDDDDDDEELLDE